MSERSVHNIIHSWGTQSIILILSIINNTMYNKSKSILIDRIDTGPLSSSDYLRFSQQPLKYFPLYMSRVFEPNWSASSFYLVPKKVWIVYTPKTWSPFSSFFELVPGSFFDQKSMTPECCAIFFSVAKLLWEYSTGPFLELQWRCHPLYLPSYKVHDDIIPLYHCLNFNYFTPFE